MRVSLLSMSLMVGALNVASQATCTDTLSLSGVREFRFALRNTATLTLDSSVIAATALAQVTTTSAKPFKEATAVQHPLQFASNCGVDSLATIKSLRVVDTAASVRDEWSWFGAASLTERRDTVRSLADRGLNGVTFARLWSVGSGKGQVYVGKLSGQPPVGHSLQWRMIVWRGAQITSQYSSFYSLPTREQIQGALTSTLSSLKPTVDSVGKGVDSVRIVGRIHEYTYSYDTVSQALTRLQERVVRSAALQVERVGQTWRFTQAQSQPLEIRTVSGQVLARLPAGRTVAWNGRDGAGQRVQGLLLVVNAQGAGKTFLAP